MSTAAIVIYLIQSYKSRDLLRENYFMKEIFILTLTLFSFYLNAMHRVDIHTNDGKVRCISQQLAEVSLILKSKLAAEAFFDIASQSLYVKLDVSAKDLDTILPLMRLIEERKISILVEKLTKEKFVTLGVLLIIADNMCVTQILDIGTEAFAYHLIHEEFENYSKQPRFIARFEFSKELERHIAYRIVTLSGIIPALLYTFTAPARFEERKEINKVELKATACINHQDKICAALISPKDIELISLKSMQRLCVLEHISPVHSLCFSANGTFLITGCEDSTIVVWEAKTGKVIKLLQGHKSKVLNLAISPDGTLLASASSDKTVRLWDVQYSYCISTLEHPAPVHSLCFTNNGASLVSFCLNGVMRLWHIRDEALHHHITRELTVNQALLLVLLHKAHVKREPANLPKDSHLLEFFKELDKRLQAILGNTLIPAVPPGSVLQMQKLPE